MSNLYMNIETVL